MNVQGFGVRASMWTMNWDRAAEQAIAAAMRYKIVNSAEHAVALVERLGRDNVFVHLDIFHMNCEKKGVANGSLRARDHLRYMHKSESERRTLGYGNVPWGSIFAEPKEIGFKGTLFVTMPPDMTGDISMFRPVARDENEVMSIDLVSARQGCTIRTHLVN